MSQSTALAPTDRQRDFRITVVNAAKELPPIKTPVIVLLRGGRTTCAVRFSFPNKTLIQWGIVNPLGDGVIGIIPDGDVVEWTDLAERKDITQLLQEKKTLERFLERADRNSCPGDAVQPLNLSPESETAD